KFIEALRANLDDEASRLVYADWLEERNDLRGEYLRLEAELFRLTPRLTELVQQIDPAWLSRVGRPRALVMLACGPLKINCIKEVRSITGLGLADAKAIVDTARFDRPSLVRDHLAPDEAERFRKQVAE